MIRTILQISFRNLIRQKRRSLLLGTAIALGAMFLVIANSFSRGISDVLFNEIAVYVAGHVKVNFAERGNYFRQIFYNKHIIDEVISEAVPEYRGKEEAIGVYGRAIGNGKSDNVMVVGMDLDAEVTAEDAEKAAQNFRMIEGTYTDLLDSTVACPVILSQQKAEYLNVKRNDVLKVRFTNALGQDQATRMTVVGIFKPSNIFMGFPVFVELEYLKPLMGYGENHIAPIQLTINDAKADAARLADSLHAKLTPRLAFIPARLSSVADSPAVAVIGFKDDSTSTMLLDSALAFSRGTLDKKSVLLNSVASEQYGLDAGDEITFSWRGALDSMIHTRTLTITGVCAVPSVEEPVVMLNPTEFYRNYYPNWPETDEQLRSSCSLLDTAHPLAAVIAPQWELLERARSSTDAQQSFRDMAQLRSKAVVMDVSSMYETASAILNLEGALNLITVAAVLVLFFIILIGVVNTLRMSVKERTREIGTIRAIGMQRNHVRWLFVLEATMLSFFASLVGTAVAFVVMWALSLPTINPGDNPMGMLLVSGHLHFVSSAMSIAWFVVLICLITAVTAYFPARRGGNMQPSDALRHFE
ncbi:MAG: ABC transporter permease [Chitinivibrionales bacterium]